MEGLQKEKKQESESVAPRAKAEELSIADLLEQLHNRGQKVKLVTDEPAPKKPEGTESQLEA